MIFGTNKSTQVDISLAVWDAMIRKNLQSANLTKIKSRKKKWSEFQQNPIHRGIFGN